MQTNRTEIPVSTYAKKTASELAVKERYETSLALTSTQTAKNYRSLYQG